MTTTDKLASVTRRDFVVGTAATATGFTLGFHLPGRNAAAQSVSAVAPMPGELNAWVLIGKDDSVLIRVHRSEMGQGSSTAIPQLLAEELECDWSKVRMEFVDANRHVRQNRVYVSLSTGGSRAIRDSQTYVRAAGASARQMLIQAAAQGWGVAAAECKAEKGVVVHAASGHKASYGSLVESAAKQKPPADVKLKPDSAWTIAGTSPPRFDVPAKVDGSAIYGMDVKVPGMVHAAIKHSPVFGGKIRGYDEAKIKSMPGVVGVVKLQGDNALAVVAERFWQAKQAADALAIVWDEGEHAKVDQAQIVERLKAGFNEPGVKVRHEGDFDGAFAKAAKKIEAEYFAPFLDHACMEPMNCTAHVKPDGVEIWVPTQNAEGALVTAAESAGVAPDKVKVNLTYLGGGFGRRGRQDYVAEAVQVAKAVGKPVKLIWTREEDIQHGTYRPISMGRLQAGLDAQGNVVAYSHKVCGQSIFAHLFPQNIRNGIDPSSVDGTHNQAYKWPTAKFDFVMRNTHVLVGFWRSVGASQNAFITESFVDEVAHAAGKDPVEFRRGLLTHDKSWTNALNMAAEKGDWGKPLPKGRGRGIAINSAFGSVTCHVAEVTVSPRGKLKVDRVVVVLDCGHAVHPDNIAAQNEGGVVYALTALLYGEITVKDGRVVQGNFDSYRMLTIDEMPRVESYLSLTKGDWWGGVGEPSMAPLMAAVCNAIFAATGKRIRSLPLMHHDLKTA